MSNVILVDDQSCPARWSPNLPIKPLGYLVGGGLVIGLSNGERVAVRVGRLTRRGFAKMFDWDTSPLARHFPTGQGGFCAYRAAEALIAACSRAGVTNWPGRYLL